MRLHILLAFLLASALQSFSQAAPAALPDLPKDPRAILAAAAPFYDFNDPSLKPWHLKASYQLYDQTGKPTETGTYEYWWVSPKVHRSTWTRPSATHTDWYTADGNHSVHATGESLKYFERELESELFAPLPVASAADPAWTQVKLQERPAKGMKYPCISLTQVKQAKSDKVSSEPFATYCFDSKFPVLRARNSTTAITTEFDSIAKFQGKFLSREILTFVGQQKMFTLRVELVGGLTTSDPALVPDPAAALVKTEKPDEIKHNDIAVGQLVKKQQPIYPIAAKAARQSGIVLLEATIGVDGKIRDLNVIYSPSKLLSDAALEAVSHWQYKPYKLNGEPVEVETTVNVIFALGG